MFQLIVLLLTLINRFMTVMIAIYDRQNNNSRLKLIWIDLSTDYKFIY